MGIFEKLKNLNKKWYLLLVAVLIIGAGSDVAAKYYFRQQIQKAREANIGLQIARSVDMDLLYLENTATTKLSPDQAKTILPLIEKLPAANSTSSPSVTELSKQIYENLSPLQYQALMEHGKLAAEQREKLGKDGEHNKKGHDLEDKHEFSREWFKENSSGNPKADALSNVVLKMLKERSVENIQNTAS